MEQFKTDTCAMIQAAQAAKKAELERLKVSYIPFSSIKKCQGDLYNQLNPFEIY